jgi:predicted permease
MGTILQDLRFAIRSLAKSPGFTAAAIVILALGIGANTAIFSLIDAVVLHPLPGVSAPADLVDLAGPSVSYPWYRSVRDSAPAGFSGLAAWRERLMVFSDGGTAEEIRGSVVSGNYFDVLGARASAGRLLGPADETSGEAIVVLGRGLWKTRFGSDPSILGRAVHLNGVPLTVVGVAPEGFRGTAFGVAPAVWVPIGAWPRLATGPFATLGMQSRGWSWLSVLGRLAPGTSRAQGQAAVDLAARREAAAFPDDAPGKISVRPTLRAAAGFGSEGNPVGFLALLLGAVGVALATACANLANLLLARAAARRREIAVRQALGASRSRLVRQMLTESIALGILGGCAGLLVAGWALGFLVRMPLPGDFSLAAFGPTLDGRALGFSLLLSVATGLVFGLVPALHASDRSVGSALKSSSGSVGPARSRARGALVVAQVALCLLLLVGAGLLGRSLQRALATDFGFQPRGLTLASVDLGLQRYDAHRAEAFLGDLRQRVTNSPGVRGASWVGLVPLDGGQWVETFSIPGTPAPPGTKPEVELNIVGPGFFRTMEIPLIEGREVDDGLDRENSAPVVIVNAAMARRAWPGESALGRRIEIAGSERTVVGVCRDFRTGSLGDAAVPQAYVPISQSPGAALQTMTLLVRRDGPRGDAIAVVRSEIRALDPELPVTGVRAYETDLGAQLVPQRLGSALLGLFGLLSLALAAVGVYAVISYSVAGRTREIGIRMALGARAADVRNLVVTQSAVPVAIGLAFGIALGTAAARLLRGFLYGISPWDPVTFGAVTVLLLLSALVAAWLPARRAARIDPMTALRSE